MNAAYIYSASVVSGDRWDGDLWAGGPLDWSIDSQCREVTGLLWSLSSSKLYRVILESQWDSLSMLAIAELVYPLF